MFTLRRDELYQINEQSKETENLIRVILRSYTGLFSDYAYISEETLALRSGLTRQRVYDLLVLLSKRGIVHYVPGKKTPYVVFTRERQETDRIVLNREVYEARKVNFERRIKAMMEYADSETNCRSRMLLRYFGEDNRHNCGQCDICLQKHASGLNQGEFEEISNQITAAISESPLGVCELTAKLGIQKEKAMQALSYLLSEEAVVQKDGKLFIG